MKDRVRPSAAAPEAQSDETEQPILILEPSERAPVVSLGQLMSRPSMKGLDYGVIVQIIYNPNVQMELGRLAIGEIKEDTARENLIAAMRAQRVGDERIVALAAEELIAIMAERKQTETAPATAPQATIIGSEGQIITEDEARSIFVHPEDKRAIIQHPSIQAILRAGVNGEIPLEQLSQAIQDSIVRHRIVDPFPTVARKRMAEGLIYIVGQKLNVPKVTPPASAPEIILTEGDLRGISGLNDQAMAQIVKNERMQRILLSSPLKLEARRDQRLALAEILRGLEIGDPISRPEIAAELIRRAVKKTTIPLTFTVDEKIADRPPRGAMAAVKAALGAI
ncbi:MAG: hypothetical protein HY589_04915 [Candidatus Omnitrophica bacterium]|nr:hypothetical protein [Candidatus Omnitrophota bacterium]